MKIKASWVAFVPVTVGAVLLHLYYLFFIGGEDITQPLYGDYSLVINKTTEPEIIAILAAVLLVFALLFSLTDRKTASYCEIKGAPISGLFLIVSGLLLGMDGAVNLMNLTAQGDAGGIAVVFQVLSVVTALIFAIVGMGLLVGFNIAKKIRLVMLIPTIWAAVNMVNGFISHRKEASTFAFFDMFVWVTATLFIFYSTMVLCGVEIKNPVKSSFVWGLEFILYAIVYVITSVNDSIAEVGTFDFTQLVPQLMFAAFALYALSFLLKLSSSMITKEQELALETNGDAAPKKKKKKAADEEDKSDEPEAAFGVGSTKYVTAEFEKIRMEKAAKKAKERTGTGMLPTEADDDVEDEEGESLSTLDKIDQLIQELSDDTDEKK